MRSNLAVALLAVGLSLAVANCAGKYSAELDPHPDSGLGNSFDSGPRPPDGAVLGPDGGIACVQVSDASVVINDQCPFGNKTASLGGTYSVSSTCAVALDTAGSDGVCTGFADGGANAFDGGCTNGNLTNCISASLPGVVHCTQNGTPCSIFVCDASAVNCP